MLTYFNYLGGFNTYLLLLCETTPVLREGNTPSPKCYWNVVDNSKVVDEMLSTLRVLNNLHIGKPILLVTS